MEFTSEEFSYFALFVKGFFFGTYHICQLSRLKLLKQFNIVHPGLYSGIFAIHLHHHGSQQKTDDKAKNILFYALWVLYALTAATSIIDMLPFSWRYAVSMYDYCCSTWV